MTNPHLPLCMLAAASALLLAAHAHAATESHKGICAFIAQEDAHLAAQVEGRTGAAPDRFVGKAGQGSTYRFEGRDAQIDYRLAPDGRASVVSSVMDRSHVAARGWSQASLAQQLNLPLPLPARLELTCQNRVLYIASNQGRIESMSLASRD